MTRIITLTSGSDGAGTGIAITIASRLAAAGKRVCLFELVADATASGNRVNVPAVSTLSDRLHGVSNGPLPTMALPAGFDLVVGGAEPGWLRQLSFAQRVALTDDLQSLDDYDLVLIDAGSGTHPNQLAFPLASPELWLVVTPEPAALSEAYTRLKLLYAEGCRGKIEILVNKVKNHEEGQHSYDKFKEIAGYYLDMQLPLAGMLGEPDEDDTTPAGITTELNNPVDRLLGEAAGAPHTDMATFGRHYLQAVDNVNTDESDIIMTPSFSDELPDSDLQRQLDDLSGHVDELIAQVERLRREETTAAADLIPMPSPARQSTEQYCNPACIAALANHTEQVKVQGDSIVVYHMHKANGGEQRFAFHSIDDDLEEPEPRTHLS